MSLGENLRRLRQDAGLTQAQLSELSGIKVNQISKLEQDGSDPYLSTLRKLMTALKCTPNELLANVAELALDARLKQALQRAAKLPLRNQLSLFDVVEKYCIACRIEEEYSDPEEVGFSAFMEMAEYFDPDMVREYLAEQAKRRDRYALDEREAVDTEGEGRA